MNAATVTPALIDEVLPTFDFRSQHNRLIAAPPDAVRRALERLDVGRDTSLTRWLFVLRGLGAPGGSLRDVATRYGFTVLAEHPEEIVVGTTGRFWTLRERSNLEAPTDLDAFRAFERPGWAKAVMSFRIEPREHGWSKLMTETRVRCSDDAARSRFSLYWAFISTFSGWIRRDVLRAVARIAEGHA